MIKKHDDDDDDDSDDDDDDGEENIHINMTQNDSPLTQVFLQAFHF